MGVRDRYEAKVDRSGGPDACHPWTAATDKGYGRIGVAGRSLKAHRVGWELLHGPIPPGLQVLHRCDNPPCQNERHWFLGTHADNMADKNAKGRGTGGAPPGERNGRAKLSAEQVTAIRASIEPQRALAARFGVSGPQISRIRRGHLWVDVPGETP